MENKKNKLTQSARNSMSLVIAIIGAIIMYCDYKLGGVGSTPFQWLVLIIAFIWIVYLIFLYDVPVIEYDDYPTTKPDDNSSTEYFIEPGTKPDDNSSTEYFVESGLKRGDGSNDPKMHYKEVPIKTLPELVRMPYLEINDNINTVDAINNQKNPDKQSPMNQEDNKNQPQASQTMSRPEIKPLTYKDSVTIDKPKEAEYKESKTPLNEQFTESVVKKSPPRLEPVRTYTLNGVAQKRRGMFNDICSFATTGEFKTLAEINKKIAPHGLQYDMLQPEGRNDLIAFDFKEFRMPLSGYFGIKVVK